MNNTGENRIINTYYLQSLATESNRIAWSHPVSIQSRVLVHGAHHFCTFMAPALIEAAATVSQTSAKNFDFIQRHFLEELANNFPHRHRIATTPAGRTLETSSGRFTTQVENTVIKGKILDIKDIKRDIEERGSMNVVEGEEQSIPSAPDMLAHEKDDFDQSSELRKLSNGETCASSKAEGGKSVDTESRPSPKCSPRVLLKERTKNNESRLQALERRARSLKQRVRSFQTGRLLSHVKTQAQLLDYSHKVSRDPRIKPDLKLKSSLHSSQDSSKNFIMKPQNLDTIVNTPTVSNSSLASVLRSEPKLTDDLGQKGQSPSLGPNKSVTEYENHVNKILPQNKQEVFGVLTNSVKDIMNLDDPDATDPESEDDDIGETSYLPPFTEARGFSKM